MAAASTSAGSGSQATKPDWAARQAGRMDWDIRYWASACSWDKSGAPRNAVGVCGCGLSLRNDGRIQMMECRDRLESAFVGRGWVWERVWAEEVVVVGIRFEVVVGDCGDGELRGARGSGRRGIGFRRERGRRGLLQIRDVY